MKTAALIMITYKLEDIPDEAEEYWIIKLIKVTRTLKNCRDKLDVIERRTLKMLEVICKYRLNN